jgi:protocatechuate 3,4-dioxygenase beta subunit
MTRRGLLAGGAAFIVSRHAMPATPSCTLVSEQEVGPYYIDDEKLRRNITEGKPGTPLALRVALMDAKRCTPLANAALDIWQCDALGVYSGFTANSPDGGPGMRGGPGGPGGMRPPGSRQTDKTRFLRGVQMTDRRGIAEFVTLYPGWYSGRAIHIHVKVHLGGDASGETYAGGHVSHTGQLFFSEDVTEQVAKLEPYVKRINVRRTLQSEDGIFNSQRGNASLVNLTRLTNGTNADGFLATVTLAVDPEATPAPVGGFGRRGGGPPS